MNKIIIIMNLLAFFTIISCDNKELPKDIDNIPKNHTDKITDKKTNDMVFIFENDDIECTDFISKYFEKYKDHSLFLNNFPYSDYLKYIDLKDTETLENDLLFIHEHVGRSYEFFKQLINEYIVINISNLDGIIELALLYLNINNNKMSKDTFVNYQISKKYNKIGRYILHRVSIHLSENKNNITKNELDKYLKTLKKYNIIFRNNEPVKNLCHKTIKLQEYNKYYPVFVSDGSVIYILRVFRLIEGGSNKNLGYSIWIDKDYINTKYFADEGTAFTVYERFSEFNTNKKNIILAASGGFINKFKQPEGLTAENGKIINASLLYDRDALLLFDNYNIERLINLKLNTIKFNDNLTINNPREDLKSYSLLIDYIKENKLTVYQSQLLAYDNTVLYINNFNKKERRLFCSVKNTIDNKQYYVIFNYDYPVSLYDSAVCTFDYLNKDKYYIDYIINMDTGGFNILEVYNNNNKAMAELRGIMNIRRAVNLLVFYIKEEVE